MAIFFQAAISLQTPIFWGGFLTPAPRSGTRGSAHGNAAKNRIFGIFLPQNLPRRGRDVMAAPLLFAPLGIFGDFREYFPPKTSFFRFFSKPYKWFQSSQAPILLISPGKSSPLPEQLLHPKIGIFLERMEQKKKPRFIPNFPPSGTLPFPMDKPQPAGFYPFKIFIFPPIFSLSLFWDAGSASNPQIQLMKAQSWEAPVGFKLWFFIFF